MNQVAAKELLERARAIQAEANELWLPPAGGGVSFGERVIMTSLTRGTRGYIERLTHQINGTYEHGWYDSCAVMIRRLLETLIIEAFEHHQADHLIKNSAGDFLYLRDLIVAASSYKWNLGRNAKSALGRLKDIGDKSAHSRRFIAQRGDIDQIIPDLRIVVQEFLYLAGLR